jgi:RNA polymerase sigma-70 factor (ECF subfamily)
MAGLQVDSSSPLDWCRRLYEQAAHHLVLYGRALGLSHGEAEDVLQDTFHALLRLGTAPQNAERYCFRSFRNRALNYRRSLWRRLAREFESAAWFERDAETSPAEQAAMRCLAGLPANQREVIVLKIWRNYTFEEIAELLEIPANTAAGRYRYGLQRLRNCLNEKAYEQLERTTASAGFLESQAPIART